MDELESLRRQIDAVDDALLPLLRERMALAEAVAACKAQHGLPVQDEAREQQILDSIARCCGNEGDAVQAVFAAMLEASRTVQQRIINGENVDEPKQ